MESVVVLPRIQNTLLNNRVKILKLCDYFTVSAPLIAKRILPLEKHKEIRKAGAGMLDPKAANTARMDALLDFIDELSNVYVFDAFLEGVKNCEASKQFAKVLKKEVEGGNDGIKLPSKFLPKAPKSKTSLSKPRPPSARSPLGTQANPPHAGAQNGPPTLAFTKLSVSALDLTNSNNLMPDGSKSNTTAIPPAVKKKTARKSKVKVKVESSPHAGNSATDVFAFNPSANPHVPIPIPKPRSARTAPATAAKKGGKAQKNIPVSVQSTLTPATASNNAGAVALPPTAKKVKKPVIKKVYPPKTKAKAPSKVVTPGPSLTATLVFKKPEVGASLPTNLGTPKVSSDGTKVFATTVPAGSPFRPKNGVTKSHQHVKEMTFLEAEDKQKSTIRATGFSFSNPQAVVKKIYYNNKSDLFYEGCPTKEGNYLCTKKVQLKGKGKKYVCKDKHENEAYGLFPRLFVTFEDPTAQMETTVFRENVEILAGKSVSEMQSMDDTALSSEFGKAIGMNIPIRVTAEKVLKKDLKVSGGKTWNNVAHIMSSTDSNSSGPPPKKMKKTAGAE